VPTVILECEDLCKSFGGIKAADHLSLSFEAGKVTALIGPNGAGKTTIFHLISGSLKPDGGKIALNGRRIDGRPPWQVASLGVGRLFQDVRVFPRLTVRENVLVASPMNYRMKYWLDPLRTANAAAPKDQIERLLAIWDLAPHADVLAGALSYGQQKLLAMARLTIMNPLVLLLDEPTAGINLKLIPQLMAALRRLAGEGAAVVVIEHNMQVVLEVADWVYFLDEGQVTAFGLPAEVLSDSKAVRAYLGV
jgi:ABC-type branched-subunit amino acid transport system ATPase component